MRLGPHDIVRPDLAGWRRNRLHDLDALPVDVVPDWICEVLSESTRRRDLVTKKRLFAATGVPYYWIVDPDARTLTAQQLVGEHYADVGLYDERDVARVEPFSAIELPVGRLFPP